MSDLDWHLRANADLLEALSDNGDIADRVRPVVHSAYFGDAASADAVREELEHAGFAVEVSKRRFKKVWELEAVRDETVTADAVDAFTRAAFSVVDAGGGEYDGWYTEVVEE